MKVQSLHDIAAEAVTRVFPVSARYISMYGFWKFTFNLPVVVSTPRIALAMASKTGRQTCPLLESLDPRTLISV